MYNHNQRIQLTDSFLDIAMKLSEGNPGALSVIMKLMEETPRVDPDAAFGPYAGLLSLDTGGIYGPRIWMFYKDVAGSDMVRMIGLQRAVQLGLLNDNDLDAAIDGRKPMTAEEVNGWIAKVREQLPAFGQTVAT